MGFNNIIPESLGTRKYEFSLYDSSNRLVETFRTDDINCRYIVKNLAEQKRFELENFYNSPYTIEEKDNSATVEARVRRNFSKLSL